MTMNEFGNVDFGALGSSSALGESALQNGMFDFLKPQTERTAEQKESARESRVQTTQDIIGIASGFMSQLGPGQQQEYLQQPPAYEAEAPEPAGLPWGWIIGGLAVTGLMIGGVYLMTQD